MTTGEKVARKRLSLVDVATVMGNVSKPSEIMLYSQQLFFEIHRNDQRFGSERLLNRLLRSKTPHRKRVGELEETSILSYSQSHPTHSLHGAAQNLVYSGIQISSGGVHGVWSRHILLTRHEGLLRLEQRYWTNTRTFRSSNAASGALQPEFRTATSRLNKPAPWLSWTCSWSTASMVPGGFTCSRSSTATAAMPLGSGTSASSL